MQQMFGMTFCTTLSLEETLASKIRHKHVLELHVITVRKTSACERESPLQLVGVAGQNKNPCQPHPNNCVGRKRKKKIRWETRTLSLSENPSRWSSARLSEEQPTDMCNQPHVSLSHSLPLWLMSPPDSIEAIRQ